MTMRNPFKGDTKAQRDIEPTSNNQDLSEFYSGSKSKILFCHFLLNGNKEVGKPKKVPLWSQEVTWRKRIYPIEQSRIMTDNDGIAHTYLDANDCSVLSFNKDHTDKCKKCGGKMWVDARNVRDLVKKKTITAIWGIDTIPMLLLIILAVSVMVMVIAFMYVYGDNQSKQTKIDSLTAQINPKIEVPPITNGGNGR